MKKIFIIILLLLQFIIPYDVLAKDANVAITNIEMVEKSEHVTEESNTSISNNSLKFDLKFWNVDDYIKYRVTFKNDDDEDYYLKIKADDDTLSYEISNNKITKKSSTAIDITIKYAKEVSTSNLDKSVSKTIPIQLNDKNGLPINPKTGRNSIIILALLLLIITILLIIHNKKLNSVYMIILVIFATIPIIVFAKEEYELSINVKYVIKDVRGLRYKGETINNELMENIFVVIKSELESRCLNDIVEETQVEHNTAGIDPYVDFGFVNVLIPDITFEALSENTADVRIPITADYGDSQEYYYDLQTQVSIIADAETGDSSVVTSGCSKSPDSVDDVELFLPYLTYDGKQINEATYNIAERAFSKCESVRQLIESLDTECIKKLIGEPQVSTQQEI